MPNWGKTMFIRDERHGQNQNRKSLTGPNKQAARVMKVDQRVFKSGTNRAQFDSERTLQMSSYAAVSKDFIRTDQLTTGNGSVFQWHERRVNVMVFRRPAATQDLGHKLCSPAKESLANAARTELRIV